LDSRERSTHHARERRRHHRLAHAGNTFEKTVPVRDHRNDQPFDHAILTNDVP
jgi:hypothetical protein